MNKFFTRFFVGLSFGTVFLMIGGWAQAAEVNGSASAETVSLAETKHCTFTEVKGTAVLICKKEALVCHRQPLANGKPGETVLVCEGGLPSN